MTEQQSMAVKRVSDPGERPLVIHSAVNGPVTALSFLQRSLLFAELSMIAYNDLRETRRAARLIGFPDVDYFDRDGSQAYRFRNLHDCVIACRGTEPDEWNDIRADANAASVLAETTGRVHRGFKQEVDDLWPMLETALMGNQQPVWFCGHSLGGAMATICAGRCLLSHIETNPRQLYTFGSPRVGNRTYINYAKLDHYRFVNNNDIVTRVPPTWFGYRHSGREVYIDHAGVIRRVGSLGKRRDRWRGFLMGLTRRRIDHFADHSIHGYIAAIENAVRMEQAASKGAPAGEQLSMGGARRQEDRGETPAITSSRQGAAGVRWGERDAAENPARGNDSDSSSMGQQG